MMQWYIEDTDNLAGRMAFWGRFQTVAERVCVRNAIQIYNRGKAEGGTPVKSGELRLSLTMNKTADGEEVGYVKDYAPHVEYGHRTVNGGYVPGQNYLSQNVETQKPIFKRELLAILEAR